MTPRIDPSLLSKPEALLWSYGISKPSEIDLEALALDQGVTVRYRPLCGCEARIVGKPGRAVITVNTESRFTRQRFSIGHELAHWLVDCRAGLLRFICSKGDVSPQNEEDKSAEADANRFASQLILPSYLFSPRVAKQPVSLDTAANLAQEFSASLTASAIKLAKEAGIPAIVICHSQQKREWFSRNRHFPQEVWPLKELHHDTDAFGMLYSEGGSMSRIKVEPAARWLSGRRFTLMEVKAQAAKLPNGSVLCLVAFC